MLFALLLSFLPFSGDADWVNHDLDIFTTIGNGHLAVNDYDETFVLDLEACQIIKLNPGGSIALRFGRKGQGPGEFDLPTNLQTFGEYIYLEGLGTQSLFCFDRQGKLVKQWKVPRARARKRTQAGWIYGTWKFNALAGLKPGFLTMVDLELKNPRVLYEIGPTTKQEDPKDLFKTEMKDGFMIFPYNPAADPPHLKVLPNGKFAALAKPGMKFSIDIYDMSSGKKLAAVSESRKPIPFSKDWGEAQIEMRNKRSAQGPSDGLKLKYKPQFPDFFPHIKEFWAHADGRFYLLPWSINPNKPAKIICFDEKGVMQDHELTPEVAVRLLFLNESHGWVSTFDEEEEQVGIAKVPRQHLAGYIKAHPISENKLGGALTVLSE